MYACMYACTYAGQSVCLSACPSLSCTMLARPKNPHSTATLSELSFCSGCGDAGKIRPGQGQKRPKSWEIAFGPSIPKAESRMNVISEFQKVKKEKGTTTTTTTTTTTANALGKCLSSRHNSFSANALGSELPP